jgi:Fur family transcriptional regulator, stress-responsive regulator
VPVIDPKSRLRAVGLRITASRIAVLKTTAAEPDSPADVVTIRVRDALGSVSTQAIYDVLHAFLRVGLIRRIEPAGSSARYETRTDDNHHHLGCRVCGRIADVDCVLGAPPCMEPCDAGGFEIDEAEVVFWGTCDGCRDPEHAVQP